MKINLNYESKLIYPSYEDLDGGGNFTEEKEITIDGQVIDLYVSYWYDMITDNGDRETPDEKTAEFNNIYVMLTSDNEKEADRLQMLEEDVEELIKGNLNLTL